MALITRISRLFTADVHAVLDRIEEPEVVLKQAVREMAEELARGEQRLRWLATEGQQLERRVTDATEAVVALDAELDLCFAGDEEELARSLVKRKIIAERHLRQATEQLDAIDREHESLTAALAEQRQILADTRHKAELLVDAPAHRHVPTEEPGISQDVLDVAFLKEKQRRQS